MMYNDICGGAENPAMNTGTKGQCLETVTVLLMLAKDEFSFDSIDDFKSKAKMDEAIQAKDIVPLYELYELTPANTDPVFYESRNFKRETSQAVKITTMEAYLSYCSHYALKSYQESSTYTRVFEVTEEGDLIGVGQADGSIKGQKMKDFNVGIRMVATVDKPPTTLITLTYNDFNELEDNAVLVNVDYNPVTDLSGIYNVEFETVSANSSEIVVTADLGCSEDPVVGIADDIVLLAADGITEQVISTVESPDGTYTITGTLVSGTLKTDGVVQDADMTYVEGVGYPITIV